MSPAVTDKIIFFITGILPLAGEMPTLAPHILAGLRIVNS
jgi:hypothetical protein